MMEIPLCGHETLASSKVLFERNPDLQNIHFVNIQNIDLMIQKDEDQIIMEFPLYSTTPQDVPLALIEALGLHKIVNSEYNKETNILLLEIEDSHILKNIKPDYEKLIKSHSTINGVLITAPSKQKEYDFESRFFWPWSGTQEDPATGGTHTFLTPYWSKRLSKEKMNSFQCSERSGFMEVEIISDQKFTMKSKAQIILKGEIILE